MTAADWPRWRQTRLVATWAVGRLRPTQHAPRLDVLTPSSGSVATLATAAPPALVWVPPQQWQPGEEVRVTTLPLQLPRTVAVAGGDQVTDIAAIYRRTDDDRLAQLPADLLDQRDLPQRSSPRCWPPCGAPKAIFRCLAGNP